MKKMKIAALSTLLVSTVVLSGGLSAFADSTYSTPGHVTLTENDEPTGPVDPTDPTKPIVDPEEEGGKETGNQGPLSLDIAPKSFDFGTQKMYTAEHTYQAVNTADATAGITNQYLQVTDNRDADTFGWVITVKQDRYLTDDTKGNTLTGSIINIPAGEARNNLAADPTAVDAKLKTSAVAIDLTEQRVFEAPESVKAGKGTSTSLWSAADVSLTIPANVAKAGDYTNNVVWTLTAEVGK
ncbi:hypothetical protein RV11_GL000697 [Enterococcus phoeniculicola]|uniref:WxL domain-containing protein n=1 Tax=Enterococcus phoeniculicola ATCC BAA-412 TaxID=1158610 RepID=R3W4J0_9ENTE|nr:WxL domain-containing protein [Enterococcus phoeniculicola]EOL42527.1 hypothetical protein UC3_02879 [Enterococcus phoeniculicola ATCC BAA-412]EOT79194.1 hypothetical protein I589_00702 [Enterococcus phoeniculicola ATCC BAA-412]OJG70982.1 hypothetical protein RV11_GL000697 [Enterococcus phoeniculicola]